MNEKIEQFISKKKEEINAKELEKKNKILEKRNRHLLKLGLIDETKSERVYFDFNQVGASYDEEKKQYYIGEEKAIEVTDEEYAEICKYDNPDDMDNLDNQDETLKRETLLKNVGIMVLIFGIIFFLIMIISAMIEFSVIGLISALILLICSIAIYALFNVIANISTSLKKLLKK